MSRVRARRVGILDILTLPSRSWSEWAYDLMLTKQYAGLMPQAIAVWCRRRGHRVSYGAYWGAGDPRRLLSSDLDVVFISAYTQASALAYALAKLYREGGVRTVLGGPHARAFPRDALRFFDLVVGDCDAGTIADVVDGIFDPGTIVAGSVPAELPSVEERMPEIRRSAFLWNRRPYASTTIPLLASTGCPYRCDFCVDWDRPYRQFPLDRLAVDLRTVADRIPGAMVSFHDPNFAVKFDAVLDVLESQPPSRRPPFIMESSLAVLRESRGPRLRATNCVMAAPGVESWSGYAAKAGTSALAGRAKVARVTEHFEELRRFVPYLQANFLFGGDDDAGGDPVELTAEFMHRTPFVWPVVNIPHPFGGTPLHDRTRTEGRLLEAMPFSFYYSPYLATVPRHYEPVAYYAHLITLFERFTAPAMLLRRLRSTSSPFVRAAHVVRTRVKRRRLAAFRRLHGRLVTDPRFRAFHDGRSRDLPELYRHTYARMLGPFASLMSMEDARPVFEDAPAAAGAPVATAPVASTAAIG